MPDESSRNGQSLEQQVCHQFRGYISTLRMFITVISLLSGLVSPRGEFKMASFSFSPFSCLSEYFSHSYRCHSGLVAPAEIRTYSHKLSFPHRKEWNCENQAQFSLNCPDVTLWHSIRQTDSSQWQACQSVIILTSLICNYQDLLANCLWCSCSKMDVWLLYSNSIIHSTWRLPLSVNFFFSLSHFQIWNYEILLSLIVGGWNRPERRGS